MSALLLVDRCRRTRRELYGLLRGRYRILATDSIFAAFRELRRREFEVIVVRTARRDAFAVALLKWLGIHRCPIPVVVLIGPGSSRDAERARELGASAVLHATARARELPAAVTSAVASNAFRDSKRLHARPVRAWPAAGLN